jgi:RNA polymerase sigma-70 factor (ECF subfamily)
MIAGDGAIVERVLAGERDEYGELVRRHQEPMYRFALGMVGSADAAADLVQDSFIKGFTRLTKCRNADRFGPWVFTILRHLCLDYLKDRRRDTVTLEADAPFPSAGDDPQAQLERADLDRAVSSALAALPDSQREAFLMKHLEGLSYDEMAELTDTSVSALKMRVMRAREGLHAMLAERERAGM